MSTADKWKHAILGKHAWRFLDRHLDALYLIYWEISIAMSTKNAWQNEIPRKQNNTNVMKESVKYWLLRTNSCVKIELFWFLSPKPKLKIRIAFRFNGKSSTPRFTISCTYRSNTNLSIPRWHTSVQLHAIKSSCLKNQQNSMKISEHCYFLSKEHISLFHKRASKERCVTLA